MLLKQKVPIGPDTTAEELADTMSHAGANLVIETLDKLRTKSIEPVRQDDSLATFAPRLTKDMGAIDWKKPAQEIHNLVRGLCPWPGTFTMMNGAVLKIITTRMVVGSMDGTSAPGTLFVEGGKVMVACGENGSELLELLEVQPPNKSRMNARDWSNGAHIKSGVTVGSQ